ncbi:Chromatin structure-remodeling complex protein [Dirofilaria immitis]
MTFVRSGLFYLKSRENVIQSLYQLNQKRIILKRTQLCDIQTGFKIEAPDTREQLIKYWMGTLEALDTFWETWKRE